jgi:glycosyltransferase involved in cell wall biosynthesis
MKILIVAHNVSSGGAATACRRLIRAFECHQGYQVLLLSVKEFNGLNKAILKFHRIYCALLSKLDIYICKYLNNGSEHWQSSGLVGSLTARRINRLNPNVVNVHWIGHATISIRQLKKVNLPIIITMHDEWWVNAINHYEAKSEFHRKSSVRNRVISTILKQKMSFLSQPNVKIVSPSSELRQKILNFLGGANNQVYVIPNPISSRVFYPTREGKNNKNVLLYAGGTTDFRKGYDLLINALNFMNEICEVLVLGTEGVETAGASNQITISGLPWVNSEDQMNRIYGESSMTLVPSRQEAFGQVASESLMAGTPVTSFEVGGLKDIVINRLNGYLIKGFDTAKMAEVLDDFLVRNHFDREDISQDAKRRFSEQAVVQSYLSIL